MAFMGMRGTGDWATDQRPKNWREMILRLFPNGTAPITAIMSKLGNERTSDPEFNWWTKSLPLQASDITNIYTDAALSIPYVSGGTDNDIVYVKISASDVTEYRVGHEVILRDASDLTLDVIGKVVAKQINGASSYVAVKLIEDDDNSTQSKTLADADRILINGSINAEGANIPDTIAYDPTKWFNYTQIFRTPLEITRTAKLTTLRTGDQYLESKRETLELHSIEMEKAFMFGVSSEKTGDNGKPERTTLGLIPAIKGGYTGHGGDSGTVVDYPTDTNFAGKSWLNGGEDWLDNNLEILFRFGKKQKLAIAGSGAILAIQKIVKNGGTFLYKETTTDYGINIGRWTTAFGVINILNHPLMSYEPTTRKSMVIYEPENVKFRFITDTMFKKDDRMDKGSWTAQDGIKEEYLTEAGFEYHHPIGWGYFTNLGVDSTL